MTTGMWTPWGNTAIPEPCMFNATTGWIVMTDGSVLSVESVYDKNSEETDDYEEGVAAIAMMPDGRWLCVDLIMLDWVGTH